MKDLHEFTKVYVNPKLRKMRMEAYAIIAPYPTEYPTIKNACLKWAWKQAPNKGWCPLPPSISQRFAAESKFQMVEFMTQLEASLLQLTKIASTVVEDDRTKVKWIAEVEIGVMAKVFAVPKSEPNKSVHQQETELRQQCAVFIATKWETLWQSPEFKSKTQPEFPVDNDLLKMVVQHLQATTKATAASSVVTEKPVPVLVPKVIQFDEDGRPLSRHETVRARGEEEVETIPWALWASDQAKRDDTSMAKMLLSLAMASLHDNDNTPKPIALVKKSNTLQALTTMALETRQLVIPLFFKKQSSVVTGGDGSLLNHKAVSAKVSWTKAPTADQQAAGLEAEETAVTVHVQPELKLPTKGDQGLQWSPSDSVHPFWFIKRTERPEDDLQANADLVHQDLTHVMACSFKPLSSAVAELAPSTETFSVSVPCIVNTRPIEAGDEVVLTWRLRQRKEKRKIEEENAYDQLVRRVRTQARPKAKGAAK